ncbi:MGMT family protein [Nocardioides daejeonensis]|uniref:MGMT family protein n=1 Tax=Nocardioides daejeonensis TaxID=1046556 RepID=UPI003083F475
MTVKASHEEYVETVLSLVESIPPGHATTYGDLAAVAREVTGIGGARQVGRVMAQYGAAVAWWRVVRADGGLPRGHEDEARLHHLDEGTVLTVSGRVDLRKSGHEPSVQRPSKHL